MKLTEKRIIEIKDRILKIDYILSESWQNTSYDNSFVELEEEQAKLEDELNKLESDIRSEKLNKGILIQSEQSNKRLLRNQKLYTAHLKNIIMIQDELIRTSDRIRKFKLSDREKRLNKTSEVFKKDLKIIESQGGFERFGS